MSYKKSFVYLRPMKSLRNILVMLLAFVVFNLGAGAGVVHICSAYCQTKICSTETHTHSEEQGCCHHDNEEFDKMNSTIHGECSCINVHYNIDYFLKVSQEDDAVSFMPMPMELPEHFTYNFQPIYSGVLTSQPSNAPPVKVDGRTLLAFHSVLIDYFIVFDRFAYDGGKYSYGYSER